MLCKVVYPWESVPEIQSIKGHLFTSMSEPVFKSVAMSLSVSEPVCVWLHVSLSLYPCLYLSLCCVCV